MQEEVKRMISFLLLLFITEVFTSPMTRLSLYDRYFGPRQSYGESLRPIPTQSFVEPTSSGKNMILISDPGTTPIFVDPSLIYPEPTALEEYEYLETTGSPKKIQEIISNLLSSPNEIMEDGSIRLVEGRDEFEGNIEVFHDGKWGSVCDDEWDMSEVTVICRQLGLGRPLRYTHSSQYGYTRRLIWMDNVYCHGTEKNLTDCRFDGWGVHDCERTEGAGVRCTAPSPPPTPTAPSTTARPKVKKAMSVRLTGGRTKEEGRVEISFEGSENKWHPVCGNGWDIRSAMIVCRELGLKYAQNAFQTHLFSRPGNSETPSYDENVGISGVSCLGTENRLSDCYHDETVFCPNTGIRDVAGVVCVDVQADLAIDVHSMISSTHLEDKTLFSLQCAMEENCLASEAYELRINNPNFHYEVRRLLRFTTSIENIGDADFRPMIPKSHWEWHACHAHYHSMEVFAHFDVYDFKGARVAEGHKASFCLEDRECYGKSPVYSCENFGDQGISPGCKDIYYHNIDCQWLDMTEVDPGNYIFRMAINPEYKVAEQSFENNAVVCNLTYTQQYARLGNCIVQRP